MLASPSFLPISNDDHDQDLKSSHSSYNHDGLLAAKDLNSPSLYSRYLNRRLRTSTLKSMGAKLLPSYLPIGRNSPVKGPRKLHPTSYLDGVRGVASLFVFIHHYPLDYFPYLHDGFLAKPTDTSVFQLPFIRIIYSGRFMVGLFFVLSGYVLSYKPLQLLRDDNLSGLLDNLASSVFRRAIRLFLPIILSTYVVMLLIHNGVYGSINPVIKVPKVAPLGQQTWQWLSCLVLITNPFTWDPVGPKFSNQLWTLPVEFRGSMLIFLSLLGLSKAKTAIRMFAIGSFALWTFCETTHWDMALFLSGIILAELRHIRNASNTTYGATARVKIGEAGKSAEQYFWYGVFGFAWFLACWPDFLSDKSPGYIWLSSMTPRAFPGGGGRTHFWTSIAAVLLLLALEHSPNLQRPFTTPVVRYLGDISFALYIVHIPICYSIGRMITLKAMGSTGLDRMGFMLAASVVTPMVFWTADVYWRLIDAKSVEVAKWLWTASCRTPASK